MFLSFKFQPYLTILQPTITQLISKSNLRRLTLIIPCLTSLPLSRYLLLSPPSLLVTNTKPAKIDPDATEVAMTDFVLGKGPLSVCFNANDFQVLPLQYLRPVRDTKTTISPP